MRRGSHATRAAGSRRFAALRVGGHRVPAAGAAPFGGAWFVQFDKRIEARRPRALQRDKAGRTRSVAKRREPAAGRPAGAQRATASLLAAVILLAVTGAAEQGKPVEQLRVQVLKTYPHDRGAFTQGLLLHQGTLYESTGQVGQSSLRQVEVESGRVIRKVDVPRPYFAEGLALVGDRLIQLTWQNGRAFVYDRRTLMQQSELTYRGEGWGLCYDGTNLVMSDGSANLTYRKPSDFAVVKTVRVTMDGRPFAQLNELECVDGAVYANVWQTETLVRIDPASGRVTQRISAPNLLSPLERQGVDVLNGITYDPADKTFLITGKYWPKLFRVKFVK